ncbi:MAG TPA: transglutaminase-like domain-containing protein, partial [Pyrinomonadaceae bacterium]|nr:transglutaminase-like domain-containing protein [Pyrinomonadaceae bacterium]
IEPGVIVEYRYSEAVKNDSLNEERLIFQRDIPMQRVTYSVRPYEGMFLNFNFRNMEAVRFTSGADGFYVGTLENVPALRDEPYMPPEDEVRRWARLYYGGFNSFSWSMLSSQVRESFDKIIKPTKELNQKAAELTAGALTEEEKLRRIYDFTQKRIKNVNFDSSYTEEQLESIKIRDADDVLKRGVANAMFVNWLFAALAKAAGFEVNIVLAGDRSENFFNPNSNINPGFLHPAGVAVRMKEQEKPVVETPATTLGGATMSAQSARRLTDGQVWKYFDPGTIYLPFGRLVWNEEDVYAMLVGESGHQWRKTPLAGVLLSPSRRSGKFKLLEDGTLEGTVRLEYEGHQAISRRRAELKDSPDKREENIRDEIKKRISAAEISGLTIENFDNPALPLAYAFKIRVPNYAQKTGKRLFFQPGFFEYGTSPVFSSATRTHSIYFQYPWSEQDELEFELPDEFLLDSAESPAYVADPQKIGSLRINIGIDKVTNKVIYKRDFYFGNSGLLLFPVSRYEPLKGLFDAFHKADTHTITLKQK